MINNPRSGHWRVGVILCSVLVSTGCASMASRVRPPSETGKGSAHYLESVPPVSQKAYQCGPAALESVFRYWGYPADSKRIADALFVPGSHGVLDFTLSRYARTQGFWTQMHQAPSGTAGIAQLKTFILRKIPPIVMLKTGVLWVPTYHFVVLKGFDDSEKIFYANIGEPETYAIDYSRLESRWKNAGYWTLILCPPERVDWDLNEADSVDLALYCDRYGKHTLAEKWYRRALEQDPTNVPVRFNLANIYLKLVRFEEAKAIYAALLLEKRDSGSVANNLSWIYLEQGRPREAADVIELAFKNGAQRSADILDTLGMAHCRLKEYGQARKYLLEAAQKVPSTDTRSLALVRQHLAECEIKNF